MPDRRDKIVLADDTVAVLHEEDQQIEDLGLNGNGFGPSQKLATIAVKRMIPKDKLHVGRPQLRD